MNNNINNINENAIKEKYLRGNKTKLTLAKIATALMIAAAILLSRQFFPDMLTAGNAKNWIHDTDKILNTAITGAINNRVVQTGGTEIVFVVERDKNNDLVKRAENLFRNHRVNDNGILLLIAIPEEVSPPRNFIEEWGRNVGEFFESLFGNGRYPYASAVGRNVPDPHLIKSEIENIIARDFQESYIAGNYNAAVLNTFNAFLDYFGYEGVSLPDPGENQAFEPTATATSLIPNGIPSMLGVVAILGGAMILVGIFSGKKYKSKIRRVYRNPSWFGQ
jgi:uncharacterized membrane protein YgcG